MSTASDETLAAARAWLAQDPDGETRAELRTLLDAAESGDDAAAADLTDRFVTRLAFGTAGLRGELGAGSNRMNRVLVAQAAAGIAAAVRPEELLAARKAIASVQVEAAVLGYVRRLVAATRESPRIRLGAGPRAGIHLLVAAKARAALGGRPFVTPDDLRALTGPVLRHRLLLAPEAELDGVTPGEALEEVLGQVEVPR